MPVVLVRLVGGGVKDWSEVVFGGVGETDRKGSWSKIEESRGGKGATDRIAERFAFVP